MKRAFNILRELNGVLYHFKMHSIHKFDFNTVESESIRPVNRISIHKMKFDTMINNLFTAANWKKAVLIVPVLLLSLLSSQAQDQMAKDSILVKGVVVSGSNAPLSNITINIEGSRQLPAVTNEAGEFTIKSSAGDNWFIFSPVSDYKTKRVFLNNRKELKVYLTAKDLSSGDDPLTILSQRTIKKDIVSSYFDLNASESYKTGAFSIDEFMQGKVPGMNVIRKDGSPASGAVSFFAWH